MSQILEGVTIADFTQLMQGGWAAQKLGDMGADVIKIEPEHGEKERYVAFEGKDLDGITSGFLAKNRNKRSVTLDLKSEFGKQAALDIIAESDVVIQNFRPGVMDRLGLGYEDVKEINEDVIYVSASGYGETGPYSERPGQDLLYQAMTGMTSITGREGEPPTPSGSVVIDEHSATLTAMYTIGALFHRERTGEGQKIESNLLNSAIDMLCNEITHVLNTGENLKRSEKTHGSPFLWPPYGIYKAENGYIAIGMSDLSDVANTFGLESLNKYETPEEKYNKRDEIHTIIEEFTESKPADELVDMLVKADVQAVEVVQMTDIEQDPQIQHNEMLIDIEHPEGGTFKTTGFPVSLSETPNKVTQRPPKLGEHTEEVLSEIGYDEDEIAAVVDSD